MYIILGATGHVGSAVTDELISKEKLVTVITRNPGKAAELKERGATAAVVDVHDTVKLAEAFARGSRLFLLNPPAPLHTDPDREERETIASILKALKHSSIEKVVAESTYGAQPGERIGDLGTLYEMEQGLKDAGIPHTIIRAGYYMSNWDFALDSAIQEGRIYSFFPPHFKLGMVAPKDIGAIAAEFLMDDEMVNSLQYVEGPARYSPSDVAMAFSKALNKEVEAIEIPKDRWEASMKDMGFSEEAAASMAGMTNVVIGGDYEMPESPRHGPTTIDQYIAELVRSRQETLATASGR